MKKFIIYTRVSTQKQGLGLDAQLTVTRSYAASCKGEVIAEYSEKESGKQTINRPVLQECIKRCKAEKVVLLVAKLDRLSRDVADIFSLRKMKGLDFEVCDCDASDTMILGITAALAQKERELISKRTKEALAEVKKRPEYVSGEKKLGNPHAAETIAKHYLKGAAAWKRKADEKHENKVAFAAIRFMKGTLQAKADYLNELGFTTSEGKKWHSAQVQRLIARYKD